LLDLIRVEFYPYNKICNESFRKSNSLFWSASFQGGKLEIELHQLKWSPHNKCLKPLWRLKFSN